MAIGARTFLSAFNGGLENPPSIVSTTKPFQTTKLTKGTKGSGNHDFKLRVLRAFVVETLFSILQTGNPEKPVFYVTLSTSIRQTKKVSGK
jgi:hypothetical protein